MSELNQHPNIYGQRMQSGALADAQASVRRDRRAAFIEACKFARVVKIGEDRALLIGEHVIPVPESYVELLARALRGEP